MSDQLTRGNLPHWYRSGFAHFVTYRLAGSLPATVVRELREERIRRLHAPLPPNVDRREHREKIHKQTFAKYDKLLDAPSSVNWLANESVASTVRENLYHHHRTKYELLAYCIMPNHVHVLLQPLEIVDDAASVVRHNEAIDAGSVVNEDEEDFETADSQGMLCGIMHSLKSFTANRANKLLGRTGSFWQKESYDHWVRDVDELERIVAYIAANPVRAGLCEVPEQWRFSSANDRFQQDGSNSALVGWLRDDWHAR